MQYWASESFVSEVLQIDRLRFARKMFAATDFLLSCHSLFTQFVLRFWSNPGPFLVLNAAEKLAKLADLYFLIRHQRVISVKAAQVQASLEVA